MSRAPRPLRLRHRVLLGADRRMRRNVAVLAVLASAFTTALNAAPVTPRVVAEASPPANAGASGAPVAGPERVLADGEVPSLRTATSRTYRLPSGVYQARVFGHQV